MIQSPLEVREGDSGDYTVAAVVNPCRPENIKYQDTSHASLLLRHLT